MAAQAFSITVPMSKTKETPGTVVYGASTPEGEQLAKTLYIQNAAFNGVAPPDSIEVTVKAVK